MRRDDKPLAYIFCIAIEISLHQWKLLNRQMSYVSEFTTDICHVKGSASSAADALSRLTIMNALVEN